MGESKVKLHGAITAVARQCCRLRRRLAEVFPTRSASEAMLRKLSGLVPGRGSAEELKDDWSARDGGRVVQGQGTGIESRVSTRGLGETCRKDNRDTTSDRL